eukprot:scaffold8101_cov72-Skeletonema_dohrnii-CCMP3373.AAC.2
MQMMSPPRELSVIQYPLKEFDGSAESSHTAFHPHLTLPVFIAGRVSGLSQALLVSSNDLSKDLAQPGLSLFSSTASNVHSKIDQFAVLLLGKPALNVLKGATTINVLELRHLAFVLLLLLYDDSDSGVNANEVESTQDSEIPADLEEATEDEAACIHERNEAEEDVPNTNFKSSKRVSKALHSELGRHWKSPSKRRRQRRRSSRTRSKPKYYEPAWRYLKPLTQFLDLSILRHQEGRMPVISIVTIVQKLGRIFPRLSAWPAGGEMASIFGWVAGTPRLVASGGGRRGFRTWGGQGRAQFPGRNLGGFS